MAAPTCLDVEDICQMSFSESKQKLPSQLVKWYRANRRKLPWRGDPPPYGKAERAGKSRSGGISKFFKPVPQSKKKEKPNKQAQMSNPEGCASKVQPYHTWVSEIMLQQTRVEAVIDYFLRWIDTFPTVEALASASLEDVNKAWAGLGYYRRAKYLHEGAKKVVAEFGGKLPSTAAELRKIPGIGEYTAGAIASIRFGRNAALVDGNVIRVFSRVKCIPLAANNSKSVKLCWKLARELVPHTNAPGDYNQALMELGATVCTPKSPSCNACPISEHCNAYKEAKSDPALEVTRFPHPKKKKKAREEHVCVVVPVRQRSGAPEILFVKRPSEGLLAGQWEFPTEPIKCDKHREYTHRKKTNVKNLRGIFEDVTLSTRADLRHVVHVFSHIRMTLHAEVVQLSGNDMDVRPEVVRNRELVWVTAAKAETLGLTTMTAKVLKLYRKWQGKKRKAPTQKGDKSSKKQKTTNIRSMLSG